MARSCIFGISFIVCLVLAAGILPSAQAEISVEFLGEDTVTGGDWRLDVDGGLGPYGDCYVLLPDPQCTGFPQKCANDGSVSGEAVNICEDIPDPGTLDVRERELFKVLNDDTRERANTFWLTSTPNDCGDIDCGFQQLCGQDFSPCGAGNPPPPFSAGAQWIPCEGAFKAGTWDDGDNITPILCADQDDPNNPTGPTPPMSVEFTVDFEGSTEVAFYFLNDCNHCRTQDYKLYVDDMLKDSGQVVFGGNGTYLVWHIDGLDGSGTTIRFETKWTSSDPNICSNPNITHNAHLSGVFLSKCVLEPQSVCSIGDYVWEDANRNGCQDTDERAIEGVEVKLFEDCDNPVEIASTTTNADGFYEFTGLDCDKGYRVKFGDAGAIYTYTQADSCTDVDSDKKDSDCSQVDGFSGCVTFPNPGDEPNNPTIDCGYVCGGEIGNYVWLDEDEDGCQNESNTGIAEVDVTLYEDCIDKNNPKTVKTDSDGFYEFVGLCPGQYLVEFGDGRPTTAPLMGCDVHPDESAKKDSNCGSFDLLRCVDLTRDNTVDMTIDCGKVGPCLELEKQVSVDGGQTFDDADNCTDADVPVTADNAEYKLIVTNCGKEAVILDKIEDDKLGIYLVLDPTVTIQPGESVEFTNDVGQTEGWLQKEGACPNTDGKFNNTATVYGTGVESGVPVDATDPACVKCPSECGITVTKTCVVIKPEPEPFVCDDKVDALKMIWNGPGTLQSVIALPGGNDSFPEVSITDEGGNQVVTVVNYQPSTNDVIWEWQSDSGSGQSIFHLSCSDDEMDGETDNPDYPQDCGRPEGNGKSNDENYANVWLLDGLETDKGFVLDCTPLPAEPLNDCVFDAPPPPNCETLGKPTSLTFRYTGADCSASSNNQGDKSDCSGVPGSAPISITILKDLSKITVSPDSGINIGDLVTVSAIGSDMGSEVQLYVGEQFLKFHTSCSQPLAAGDVFGSLELVQFNGQGAGAEVTYAYKVKNIGDVPVDVTSVFDDKLGELIEETETPVYLGTDEFYTLYKTAFISETTTNVVTAKANLSGENTPCGEAMDEVTVTVVEPTCDIAIVLDKLEDDKIKWKITNTSEIVATLDTLTVNFPLEYGLIKEVKLDGGIFKKGDSNDYPEGVPPGVTIGQNDWTESDVSKRQLDQGETRTLEVVFTEKSKGEGWVLIDSAGKATFKEGCEVELPAPSGCDIGKPMALVFEYTGEYCVDGNDQASDKWSCIGNPSGAEPVQVVMTKDADKFVVDPSTMSISVGETFEIRMKEDGKELPSEIKFDIRDGQATLQSLKMHTSCSQPLSVGDQFGSVIVTEFIPKP